jgi:hypothetical protein
MVSDYRNPIKTHLPVEYSHQESWDNVFSLTKRLDLLQTILLDHAVQGCKTGILWQRWGNSKLQTAFHLSWRFDRNHKWWKYTIPEMHEIVYSVHYVGMKAIFESVELLCVWSNGYCCIWTKKGWESFQLVSYRHVFLLWKTRRNETRPHIFKQAIWKDTFSVSWPYSPLWDLGHFFSFLILYTIFRAPWIGYQSVTRPLPTHRPTQTQNNCTQTPMPRVWFELTIPVFERTKTVHVLDRAATVIGFGKTLPSRKYKNYNLVVMMILLSSSTSQKGNALEN